MVAGQNGWSRKETEFLPLINQKSSKKKKQINARLVRNTKVINYHFCLLCFSEWNLRIFFFLSLYRGRTKNGIWSSSTKSKRCEIRKSLFGSMAADVQEPSMVIILRRKGDQLVPRLPFSMSYCTCSFFFSFFIFFHSFFIFYLSTQKTTTNWQIQKKLFGMRWNRQVHNLFFLNAECLPLMSHFNFGYKKTLR